MWVRSPLFVCPVSNGRSGTACHRCRASNPLCEDIVGRDLGISSSNFLDCSPALHATSGLYLDACNNHVTPSCVYELYNEFQCDFFRSLQLVIAGPNQGLRELCYLSRSSEKFGLNMPSGNPSRTQMVRAAEIMPACHGKARGSCWGLMHFMTSSLCSCAH